MAHIAPEKIEALIGRKLLGMYRNRGFDVEAFMPVVELLQYSVGDAWLDGKDMADYETMLLENYALLKEIREEKKTINREVA